MNIDLTPFKHLIKERSGLSIENDDEERIRGEIRKILAEKGINSAAEYYNILVYDENEFLQFLNLLTINETYFFREPVHFRIFTQKIIPELLERKRTVRILSAGCSTGEEPYTIIMALMEKYGMGISKQSFFITGVDIDTDAIQRARQGIYHGYAFRMLDPELKNRYFEKIDDRRYQIKSIVKDIATFHCVNLLSTPYPDFLTGIDIIFYRNVSIYFDSEIQQKIFRNLSNILNENGYLIVSSTETLSHDKDILRLLEIEGVFLFQKKSEIIECHPAKETQPVDRLFHSEKKILSQLRKKESPCPTKSPLSKIHSSKPIDKPSESNIINNGDKPIDVLYQEALTLAEKKSYQNALEILNSILKKEPFYVKGQTLKAGILMNLQRIEEARQLCREAIKTDPLCVEGYLLLGLIARCENDPDEAIKQFKKTLYLNLSSWLAHFYIGELLFARREFENACREYGIVIKLLEKGHFPNHGLAFFPFPFSEKQIINLCKDKITKAQRNPHGF